MSKNTGKNTTATAGYMALIGSSLLPSHVVIFGEETVQLGTVVQNAYTVSGLTKEQWNDLAEPDREARLQATVDQMKADAAAAAGVVATTAVDDTALIVKVDDPELIAARMEVERLTGELLAEKERSHHLAQQLNLSEEARDVARHQLQARIADGLAAQGTTAIDVVLDAGPELDHGPYVAVSQVKVNGRRVAIGEDVPPLTFSDSARMKASGSIQVRE